MPFRSVAKARLTDCDLNAGITQYFDGGLCDEPCTKKQNGFPTFDLAGYKAGNGAGKAHLDEDMLRAWCTSSKYLQIQGSCNVCYGVVQTWSLFLSTLV